MTEWIAEARARLDAAKDGYELYARPIAAPRNKTGIRDERARMLVNRVPAVLDDLRRALDALDRVEKLANEPSGHTAWPSLIRAALAGSETEN